MPVPRIPNNQKPKVVVHPRGTRLLFLWSGDAEAFMLGPDLHGKPTWLALGPPREVPSGNTHACGYSLDGNLFYWS